MTWKEATEWVERELHRLMTRQTEWIGAEDLLPDQEPHASAIRDLRRLDLETRETVDAAVVECVERGEWPALSLEVRYLLGRRLFCALDLLHTLSMPTGHPLVSEPAADKKEILVWLLNQTWRARAERWLLVAASLHLPSLSERTARGDFEGRGGAVRE